MSFQHAPNILCSDLAPRIATHLNLRFPNTFHPNNGCFAAVTQDNMALAKERKLKVTLPWLHLSSPKIPPDHNGHPVSGSSDRYSCLDRLHEKNWKGDENLLRSTRVVVELANKVNTQAAEHLNSDISKNTYFLNMMSPTTQVIMMRLLLEHRNKMKNLEYLKKTKREFTTENYCFDENDMFRLESDVQNVEEEMEESTDETDDELEQTLHYSINDHSYCRDSTETHALFGGKRNDVNRDDKERNDVKKDDVERDDVKRDDVKRDDVERDDVKRDDKERNDVKRDCVERDDVKRDDKERDDVKRDDLERDDVKRNDKERDGVKRDDVERRTKLKKVLKKSDTSVSDTKVRNQIQENKNQCKHIIKVYICLHNRFT